MLRNVKNPCESNSNFHLDIYLEYRSLLENNKLVFKVVSPFFFFYTYAAVTFMIILFPPQIDLFQDQLLVRERFID